MKIQYLGHSSFLLESKGGTRIVTDPYGDVGFLMPFVHADGVTVSHQHFDHNHTEAVGDAVCFEEVERCTLGDVVIAAVPSFHDEVQGKKRGNNLIFKFLIDGMFFCHLGDLGEPYSPALVEKIGACDVLLIPVGGNYTIDAAEAKKYVDAIRPSVVIPMHFKTAGLKVDIAGVDDFLKYFESVERAGSKIELTCGDLRENMKIIVMERGQ